MVITWHGSEKQFHSDNCGPVLVFLANYNEIAHNEPRADSPANQTPNSLRFFLHSTDINIFFSVIDNRNYALAERTAAISSLPHYQNQFFFFFMFTWTDYDHRHRGRGERGVDVKAPLSLLNAPQCCSDWFLSFFPPNENICSWTSISRWRDAESLWY